MKIFSQIMQRYLSVTFVRHGETTLNAKGVIQGHTDAPLSETGILQAEALGKHISNEVFTKAYSSDLIRAKNTAELILKHSKCTSSLVTDKRLRERNYGKAEGQYFAHYFEEAKRTGRKPLDYTPEGGESVAQVSERIQSFFAELCTLADNLQEKSENILIVTHGGLLKVFMMYLEASMNKVFTLENFDTSSVLRLTPNTGVTRLDIHAITKETGKTKRRLEFHCIQDDTHLKNLQNSSED